MEPRAIQAKFPLPSLHLHYVRGCSLAEAFYQSVSGPYQLLIVGDPLCQPWATFPKITVEGIKPEQEVRGTFSITASGTAASGQAILAYDLFIDGRLAARTVPGQNAHSGYDETVRRLSRAAAGGRQCRDRSKHRAVAWCRSRSEIATRKLELKVFAAEDCRPAGKVLVSVRQPGATAIRDSAEQPGGGPRTRRSGRCGDFRSDTWSRSHHAASI